MTRKSLSGILVVAFIVGCGPHREAPYPVWEHADPPYLASLSASGGFAQYALAAELATKDAPEMVNRVTFTKGMRKDTLARLKDPMSHVLKGTRQPTDYVYTLPAVFRSDTHMSGWRLLERALSWRITDTAEAGDWDNAVVWTLVATKFGLDLTQGDTQTAGLGWIACDDARQALTPFIDRMPASALLQLYKGLSNRLAGYKGLRDMMAHEERRMLLGVQYVQDCRQKRTYDDLEKALGREARQAVTFLRDLDESKRAEFFDSFAAEAKACVAHWESETGRPASERSPWDPTGYRPWKRFANAFFDTVNPVVTAGDATLARTRLFALTAYLSAQVKAAGALPQQLVGLPESLVLDPYSGRPLVYVQSGSDFRVYSVGPNFRDDGGEADDVTLEGQSS